MVDASGSEPDPEVVKWLTDFVSKMDFESVQTAGDGNSEPSELDELEFLDALVSGDEQPEALKMIMDAYYRHTDGAAK